MPSLSAVLVSAEDKKGEPLTTDEVSKIRDESACIMMHVEDLEKVAEGRGYDDIDPENCWYEWQILRRELGREPNLDPGVKLNHIDGRDPEYLETIESARSSLDEFRSMLPLDGEPRISAMVKVELSGGGNSVFTWLNCTRREGRDFVAEFFEIPLALKGYAVGDALEVTPDVLLDWMVIENGILYGGFSVRYQRSRIPEHERPAYDSHIGVAQYS